MSQSMDIVIEAAKDWMVKAKAKFTETKTWSEFVSYAALKAQAEACKMPFTMLKGDYVNMLGDERDEFIDGLEWPWKQANKQVAKVVKVDVKIPVPVGKSGVSGASAIAYGMGGFSEDTDEYKYMKMVSETFPNMTILRLQALSAKILKTSQFFSPKVELGELEVIDQGKFDQWIVEENGSSCCVGAMLFWDSMHRHQVACESGFDDDLNREYLEFERNGQKLYMYDRYMVHSSLSDGKLATEEEVNNFIGMMKEGSKILKYKSISPGAYELALAYLTVKLVKYQTGAVTVANYASLRVDHPYKMEASPSELLPIIQKLTAHITSGKAEGNCAEQAFEELARWIDKNTTNDERVSALDALHARVEVVIVNQIGVIMKKLRACKEEKGLKRLLSIAKIFGATVNPADACARLKAGRDLRNQGIGDFVNHNVEAVRFPQHAEWTSDHLKYKRMVNVMKGTALYKERDAKSITRIIGVRPGINNPTFNSLKVDGASDEMLMYVNPTRVKNSADNHELGGAYTHTVQDAWIIDDSETTSVPDRVKDKYKTGDHYKVSLFITSNAKFFITKVSLQSFKTKELMEAWKTLFEGSLYSVKVHKFGRLQNEECHMVCERGKFSAGVLSGDIQAIAVCVQAANDMVMIWQTNSLRMGMWVPSEDEDEFINISNLWRQFIAIMPVEWPWYLKSERIQVTSVQEIQASSMFDTPEFGGDDVQYDDEALNSVISRQHTVMMEKPFESALHGTLYRTYNSKTERTKSDIKNDLEKVPVDQKLKGFNYMKNGCITVKTGRQLGYGMPGDLYDGWKEDTCDVYWHWKMQMWSQLPDIKISD